MVNEIYDDGAGEYDASDVKPMSSLESKYKKDRRVLCGLVDFRVSGKIEGIFMGISQHAKEVPWKLPHQAL